MDTVKKYIKNIIFIILLAYTIFATYKVEAASDIVLTFTDTSIEETVSGSGYSITGTTLEINKAGTYRIKGSCHEGNIEVKKGTRNVILIFDNLYLASSKTAPVVIKKDGTSATIKSVGNSTIIDNEDPDNEYSSDPVVADAFEGAGIKVKSDANLTFTGSGKISVVGNAKNGIKGGQNSTITINAGVIEIDAANSGLACDHRIIINNGIVDIDAYNEGIKLEPNIDDTDSAAELTINGGRIDINAGQDGIQAMGNISINGWPLMYINSLEDGIQTRSNFTMTNGDLNIYTFEGYNPANFDKDLMSAKGIKAGKVDDEEENATNTINIFGGTVTINSSDDAIHSDGYINITKGTVNIKSGDDGIHSDTKLVIGEQNGLERDPEINVEESIEGIESGNIYMYSGKVKVVSLDDGVNAAGGASTGESKSHGEHFNPDTGQMEDNYALYIYGGSTYIQCEGDGFDANGSIYLYGGTHIIYHQDAQGNNSALDRDSRLVIDGATVFSVGGVADNGHVDSTGSGQKIIIDTTDYAANTIVGITDGGNVVFNDKIPKRSTYTFYSSPSLTNNATVGTLSEIDENAHNPWNHHFNDGVVTTPATENNPGVITYTCQEGSNLKERKTYFYKNTVEFNVVNKTGGLAAVRIGEREETTDFSTTEVDEYIYITTIEDIEFITTYDGINYDVIEPEPTGVPNVYLYHVDPADPQTFYVALDGDINMDASIDYEDARLIAKSLISPSNTLYRELNNLEKVIADQSDNGIINSHDGVSILSDDLSETTTYTAEDFKLTESSSVVLDGENDATVVVEFKADKNMILDGIDGNFLPNVDNPSSNGFLELLSIEPMLNPADMIYDSTNGFAGMVDINGMNLSKGDILFKATYKVNKNTPTGTYPVTFKVNSVTAHNSMNEKSFVLKSDVIVKGTTDPITAFFSKDEGVESIDVYYTQDYETPSETNVSSMTVRDPSTGDIIPDSGEGQVNFKVNLKSGYIISSISVEPTGKYKNIKGPADTNNADTYRITKVTGDIEIIVETKEATEFTATFNKDSHVSSIDIYYTQDYTNADELDVNKAYARNSDTGEIDISGDGQINFKVNVQSGYKIDKITVSGNYKNLKEQNNGIYRVTKISGDLIITVKSSPRTPVTPDVTGMETSYTYTGSKIKPEPDISVTIDSVDPETGDPTQITIPLAKGKDYQLTYGDNTEAGTDAGLVTITSLGTSQFIFNPIILPFDIDRYPLTMSNISAPTTIVYDGSPLTPEITVRANGKDLVEGTDYDISFTNQDGQVGENVVATVTGKGNYTGTVNDINVYITDKATQTIKFDKSEITKVYGDDFTMTATLVEGDGNITYTSNNTQAAVVDSTTGAITLIGTGQATIRAFASETATYAEAVTSYKLIVKKAPLTINNVVVNDKSYDGGTNATVSNVEFSGLVKDENLVLGTDYTADATFIDSEVGNDKEVQVTINLSTETIKRYSLENNTTTSTASITKGVIHVDDINLSQNTYTYDGTEKKPEVSVIINGNTLIEGTDYVVAYEDNIDAGTAKVIVVGLGEFAAENPIVKTFTIKKKTVTPTISNIADVTYNGGEQRPELEVTDESITLELNKDYKVEWTNNVDAGEASLKISPVDTSNYTFVTTGNNVKATFTIDPYELTSDDIILSSYRVSYDGTPKTPTVKVIANQIPLVEDLHYLVTYSNNTNIGTYAKVTVTPVSTNYIGTPIVYFEIIDKEVLDISGINDNQSITYTGHPVILQGNVEVAPNTGNIEASDLTVKWYNSSLEEIERPTDVGNYYVVYSYSDDDTIGDLKINFNITKAKSPIPEESEDELVGVKGDALSTFVFITEGLSWVDDTIEIESGRHDYQATYIKNNDSTNYEPITVDVSIYGKNKINITTSVSGMGGTISSGYTNVLEGTSKTITVTPSEGYEIDTVKVNGKVVEVTNNQVNVTAGTKDIEIVVTFDAITYSINVSGTNVDTDPYGIIEVTPNTNKSIELNTKFGYRLVSVVVNGINRISEVVDNSIVLTNINEDTNIVVKAEKISYKVIEGARQTYTINKDKAAKFIIDAEYDLFENGGKVYVDHNLVDIGNYTSNSGSTVITFKQSYLDSLKVGVHTLDVEFTDGGTASTTFTIAKVTTRTIDGGGTSTGNKSNKSYGINPNNRDKLINPKTADYLPKYILIFVICLLGIISSSIYIKKRIFIKK